MPVQFDVVWSTCYSRCILFVSTALSCRVIKYYHLSLYPRLRVPVPPSCVHRDNYIWKHVFVMTIMDIAH